MPISMCVGVNWASSGPGISWPEEYRATFIPGFDRFVVTASLDSTDAHGVTDFAIGWFKGRWRVKSCSKGVILKWWTALANEWSQAAWDEVTGGLLDADEAWAMRKQVWPGAEDVVAGADPAGVYRDPEVARREREPVAEQWATFERDLTNALGELGDDGFLVLGHEELPRYVQFAGCGERGIRAEAVGNAYLAQGERLTDAELAELERAGWSPPADGGAESPTTDAQASFNFYMDVALPSGAASAAAVAIYTLRDVFGVSAPTDLRYGAFRRRGDRIEAIDGYLLGVPRLYLGYPGAWIPLGP